MLSNEGAEKIAHTSIAMQEVQDRREVKTVPNGLALHKYANLYFDLVYATWWKDDDYYTEKKKKSIKCAETLVPYKVPYDFIVCAAVVSEQAKHKLLAVGFDKEIVVKAGLFF